MTTLVLGLLIVGIVLAGVGLVYRRPGRGYLSPLLAAGVALLIAALIVHLARR